MPAFPKPAPRPLRTPKPLKRTPLARRSARTRRVKNRCADDVHTRCRRAVIRLGRCGTHADEYLLRLRRKLVVTDRCELQDWHAMTLTQCSEEDGLQDNHGIPRGYKRGNLRWDPSNGFSGCAGANAAAHYKPVEWFEFLKTRWGREEFERRWDIALRGPDPDFEEAERMLKRLSGQKDEEV